MTTAKIIKFIVAHGANNVIGNGLALPDWHLTDDFLKNFKPKTKGGIVIMGGKTALSLGKPLPGRVNIVITRNPDTIEKVEGFIYVSSLYEALHVAQTAEGDTIWIIGGGQIYALALQLVIVNELHITKVHGSFEGDIFFPSYKENDYCLLSRDHFAKREPSGTDKGNSHSFDVEIHVRR